MFEVTYSKPDIVKLGPITTSKKELVDLLKAWLIISAAFGIVIAGGYMGLLKTSIFFYFSIAAATVGVGFIFHELAHKLVAQKYHCWAEFRSFDNMLFFALVMSLFGFVFAAPGAVMIQGTVTRDRNGKISLAGPLMNVILAMIFLGIGFLAVSKTAAVLIGYGFMINVWLAGFNMIPVWNFDGAKVWKWSKPVWITTVVGIACLFVLMMMG